MPSVFAALVGAAALLRAEPSRIPHGTVDLIPAVSSIRPGSAFQAGLLFRLEPGWHIYWKNPGDSGQPPRLRWELPSGLSAGQIEWPQPKRLPVGPLLDYGYEGEVLLPITIQTSSDLPANSSQSLTANLRVLVCRETCMPGKAALALTLPVRKATPRAVAENTALFAQANASKPKAPPDGWKVSAQETTPSILLSIQGAPQAAKISFIPAHSNEIENAAPQALTNGSQGPELKLKRSANASGNPSSLDGLLLIEQAGATSAYAISAQLARTPDRLSAGGAPRTAPSQSLPAILLLAFGGGLILNLMPCVFPVLSIKVLSLLDSSHGERKAIRLGAVVYTLGVLASFWVVVAVLLGLRAAGRNLGWGFQLQAPEFVAFLVCLLFVLGLSLIGTFEIGASLMNLGGGLTQRGKYSGSFFTGVLATVVATPCTAPLMGVAVGFALSQSPAVCTLVFTVMALGLASPFLLMSIFPQLSRMLPRPGAWMETLKQVMAFPVFATVIWLLWVLGQQVGIDQLLKLLVTLLVLSIAAWVAGKWPQSRPAKTVAVLLALGTTAYVSVTLTPLQADSLRADTANQANGGLKWEAFSPEKVASYRASGKPVLIDFTAAWCLTCQVNDRVVFHSPEVEQRLNRSDIALLRADWTSYDPIITDWLAKFGRSGIPFYVIYAPQQTDPVILPDGILTPATFLRHLEKVKL
ncbi:MAG: thioredoxin family protein [Acidobacteriaceae bacterium]|nr:thioredoxin family protein [Acidobacteriaceae bacterium]